MAQADLVVSNQSGAGFRSDVNGQLLALGTKQSGSSAPSVTYPYMDWADTAAGLWKLRNAANDGWLTIGLLGVANLGLAPAASPTFTGTATFGGDVLLSGTGVLDLPVGTTAQRPVTPNAGMIRFNSSLTQYEGYDGAAWGQLGGGLPLSGGTMTGVITFASAQPRLVSGTSVASTSGTAIDFTGIPSWAKRITVMLAGVSTSGTSNLLVQLGTSSGVEATNYLGCENSYTGATGGQFTTGFLIKSNIAAAGVAHGVVLLQLLGSNTWAETGQIATSNATQIGHSAGSKALASTLDRVRITTVNGTDTFDAGTINIFYEG